MHISSLLAFSELLLNFKYFFKKVLNVEHIQNEASEPCVLGLVRGV